MSATVHKIRKPVSFMIDADMYGALHDAARERGKSPEALAALLIAAIVTDDLYAAVLDDAL